jgi:hypothetical protein
VWISGKDNNYVEGSIVFTLTLVNISHVDMYCKMNVAKGIISTPCSLDGACGAGWNTLIVTYCRNFRNSFGWALRIDQRRRL